MTWRCAGDTFSDAKISSRARTKCHVEKLLLYSARKQHCGVTGLRFIDVATASAHATLTHVGLKRGASLPKYPQNTPFRCGFRNACPVNLPRVFWCQHVTLS
jgi:hypothetical protein